ncbi:hypothetical protein KR50_10580 [Jeotgalibacillus campisalis]|uniref:Uncharacterized protein n=1 Tax=Jeotgalibacillus campisalis TaxID=220754 RepID=A0A0C2W3H3_9BACL|nr:hypothetical protein KR50_10580 [Jeotgalibacillus campisalis]
MKFLFYSWLPPVHKVDISLFSLYFAHSKHMNLPEGCHI